MELASQSCSEQPRHHNIVRTAGAETLSASTCRTRSARRGWLITVRSMSLAVYLDLVARACHPPAEAGPSASAPHTAGSIARRCVGVPLATPARGVQSRRRLGYRDRSPSSFSSTALDRLPPPAAPTVLADSRTSRGETTAPPSAPDTGVRPSGRYGLPPWARRGL